MSTSPDDCMLLQLFQSEQAFIKLDMHTLNTVDSVALVAAPYYDHFR